MAIGQVEARHEVKLQALQNSPPTTRSVQHQTNLEWQTWAMIDVWNVNPFSGPSDTVYPYANQILDLVGTYYIVPGSCPAQNPQYPYPTQHLPKIDFNPHTTTGHPGSPITFAYTNQSMVPTYEAGKEYYAVFFHGVLNTTMPFNPKTNSSTIPAAFDMGRGIIMAVIADAPGAPTQESVLAGPLILFQQPESLTIAATG